MLKRLKNMVQNFFAVKFQEKKIFDSFVTFSLLTIFLDEIPDVPAYAFLVPY